MIPDGWTDMPLKAVLKLASGDGRPKDIRIEPAGEHTCPVYGGNGVLGYSSVHNSTADDIIIGRVGEYCGVTRFVRGQKWITDNALFAKSVIADVDREFLALRLKYFDVSKLRSKGGQPLVSQEPIYAQIFAFPPIEEQRSIVRAIVTWDRAIETVEALIANARAQKKALMQSLLTGKHRLPGFSGEWSERPIGDLVHEVHRYVEWDDNAIYKLISVRRRSEGIFHRESLSGDKILTKSMKVASKGDFLISKMQVVHGASALVRAEFDGFNISGSYIALVPKDRSRLNIEYFDWFSKLPEFRRLAYFSSYGVHIEKMTFNLSTFLRQKVMLPSDASEQSAIVERLDAAEAAIRQAEQQLTALRQEKSALMQQLLTGKRRVKVERKDAA